MTPSELLRHLDKFYIETENERVTQLTFTCSKSTIETVKMVLNIFKVNNEKTRTSSTYFTPFSSVSIATLNK